MAKLQTIWHQAPGVVVEKLDLHLIVFDSLSSLMREWTVYTVSHRVGVFS